MDSIQEERCVYLCLTFCDCLDYSPLGSSIHGIFLARMLELVAISSPEDLPDPLLELASPSWQADSLPLSHPGSPPAEGLGNPERVVGQG